MMVAYQFQGSRRGLNHQKDAEQNVSFECEGDHEWIYEDNNLVNDYEPEEQIPVHLIVGGNDLKKEAQ